MLFGSPTMLIFVLCTTDRVREEIVSPSFSKWIIKISGYIRFFVEVDKHDLVGCEAGCNFSDSVSEFAM